MKVFIQRAQHWAAVIMVFFQKHCKAKLMGAAQQIQWIHKMNFKFKDLSQ